MEKQSELKLKNLFENRHTAAIYTDNAFHNKKLDAKRQMHYFLFHLTKPRKIRGLNLSRHAACA